MTEPIPGATASSTPGPAAAGSAVVAAARHEKPVVGSHVIGWPFGVLLAVSTLLMLLAAGILLMTTPAYLHGALDRAGSADFLGVAASDAHRLSDATVAELLLGPGTFAVAFGPGGGSLYDAAEASHLRDARTVLYGLLVLAGLSIVILAIGFVRSRRTSRYWRAISSGAGVLSIAFVVIGILFLVAFDAAFTLFHEIFFPGGNWAFDFDTQHLVQLYPIPFWEEVTTALGVVVIVAGALVWWLARRRARHLASEATP